MEQIVLVRRICEDGMAEVSKVRESACSGDCHQCAGCGAARETVVLRAKNPVGAKAGDVVKIESASSPVLKAAAALYLLPILLFLCGYVLGENLWGKGVLVSLCGLCLGAVPARVIDRRLAKKLSYTVTAFVGK